MSDYEDYDNLAFPPQMPRCDIEELKAKLEQSEKMRDLQAEYACKLEEKLKIAEEALEKIKTAASLFSWAELLAIFIVLLTRKMEQK